MHRILLFLGCAGGLFLGMLLFLELGRQLGRRRKAKLDEGARPGLGAVEGAVFALLGLLVAFTFSGAASRFDARRELILHEANAVSTAWLRLDLIPASAQPELRDLFRRYLDSRLAVYQALSDGDAERAAIAKANALQGEIWSRGVAACQEAPNPVKTLLISALNQMFDIATTRTMARRTHPPVIIYMMLAVLALMSSLPAGHAMAGGKTRSWIHVVGFALIVATTVYVILDLEFPRLGILRIDRYDQVLIELRQSMR